MTKKQCNVTSTVSVRELADAIHRQGGLSQPAGGSLSGAEGIRLHQHLAQQLYRQYGQGNVATEVTLGLTANLPGLSLQVGGRSDAIVTRKSGVQLYEFKSFNGAIARLQIGGEAVHWAQARLYGHLYLETAPLLDELEIVLLYLSVPSYQQACFKQIFSRLELKDFFYETCQKYHRFMREIICKRELRLQSALDFKFPYSDLREGQKDFMQAVVRASRTDNPLLACAPTGIGKTVGALYPACKAWANHLTDKIFYLTHLTSTRQVAAQTLKMMHDQGLMLKAIVLYAKEQMCLKPDLYCDANLCPYGVEYYNRLYPALSQLFDLRLIGRQELLAAGEKFRLCPFELSLDLSLFCEIVVCDYNYAFDPRVRLSRFFGQEAKGHLLLIDEAHNLPDRSRKMFSATLSERALKELLELCQAIASTLAADITKVCQLVAELKEAILKQEKAMDLIVSTAYQGLLQAERFRAVRPQPDRLLALVSQFNSRCRQFLDDHPDFKGRLSLLRSFLELSFFCRLAQEHYDNNYITTARVTAGNDCVVTLLCLDASEKLAATYLQKHKAVFFSATVLPLSYYQALIIGHNRTDQMDTLVLPSPFPGENLLLLVCSNLSTRLKQRISTLPDIVSLIFKAAECKTGNYLVYLPSYAYLNQIRQQIGQRPLPASLDLLFQDKTMSEQKRQDFLKRFDNPGQRSLLAFAVLGSFFSEGIDLVGEKLLGVIILGVGLPRLSPEREIMKQYYSRLLNDGENFAYLYPGFNKVQQAAGRVIRSETDRGFILLIDDRYDHKIYRDLFPDQWQPLNIKGSEELSEKLSQFWG